jgi:outer membrane receptor protein involved in Fe transport
VNRTDPKNISYGNPGLKPAVTNAIELGYSTFFKGSSINPTLYYNFTNNSIQRITNVSEDGISETTSRNIGKNHTIGLSANSNISFSQKLTMNFNGNINYRDFTSVINGREVNNNGVMGSIYGGINYSFIKTWRAGINVGYQSSQVGIQTTSSGYFFNSFSINKNMLKDKLTLNASVGNPFQKDIKWRNEVKDDNFYQLMDSKWRMRRFSFSVNYRFGKLQGDIARKKRGIRNDDVSGGGQGGGTGPK